MIIPILLNEKTEHSSGELCAWAQNQLVVEQGLHRRGPWGLTKQQVTARQGESLWEGGCCSVVCDVLVP